MPYDPQQHRLFEFVAHNPKKAHAEGIKISQADASRMASEGIKDKPKKLAAVLMKGKH